MSSPDHDAVRADIPDAVVLAVLEELGWPDDRNAIQEDVNVQPGCHWDLAADLARAATAALTADWYRREEQYRAEIRELRAAAPDHASGAERDQELIAALTADRDAQAAKVREWEAKWAKRTAELAERVAHDAKLLAAIQQMQADLETVTADRDRLRAEVKRASADAAWSAAAAATLRADLEATRADRDRVQAELLELRLLRDTIAEAWKALPPMIHVCPDCRVPGLTDPDEDVCDHADTSLVGAIQALRAELEATRAWFRVTPRETPSGRAPTSVTNAILRELGWDGDTDDRRYWYTATHIAKAAITAYRERRGEQDTDREQPTPGGGEEAQ